MAIATTQLTDKKIKSAKAKEKKYKLYDGGGLFLQVNPNGSKLWRLKYRINNKDKEYAIGTLEFFSLSEAREQRAILRKLVKQGIDLNEKKKADKQKSKEVEEKKENTFFTISQKWLKSYESEVSENYHAKLGKALENYTYKKFDKVYIKEKPIAEVTRKDIIAVLETLRAKGLQETAKRTAMILNKVWKFAVTHEYVPHNIISDIDMPIVLGKREKKSYPTFTKEKDIKGLLLNIDDYQGDYSTKMALKVLPYVFVRSYNIRHMEWEEIDFKAKEWVIPAEKMKTKTEFILPLPHQVIDILKELEVNALSGVYVFPSRTYKDRPLSDNTLISALRRMGYTKEEFVPHGFRAMFSTIANEKANEEDGHSYTAEVVEALLAHKEPNKVKSAYNRSEYREPMRGLMQWYADYLEGVKRG